MQNKDTLQIQKALAAGWARTIDYDSTTAWGRNCFLEPMVLALPLFATIQITKQEY
jgi:hypothetical protein